MTTCPKCGHEFEEEKQHVPQIDPNTGKYTCFGQYNDPNTPWGRQVGLCGSKCPFAQGCYQAKSRSSGYRPYS